MCPTSEHVPENVTQLTTAAHSCGRLQMKTVYCTGNAIQIGLINNTMITNTASQQYVKSREVNSNKKSEQGLQQCTVEPAYTSRPQVDHLWSTIMSILMDKKLILGFWPTSSTWQPHINQVKLWNPEKWKEKLFQGFRGIAYQNIWSCLDFKFSILTDLIHIRPKLHLILKQ